MPVTAPVDAFTVATDVALLLQMPPAVASDSIFTTPGQLIKLPVITAIVGNAWTVFVLVTTVVPHTSATE